MSSSNHHSLERQLLDLHMQHVELNARIDQLVQNPHVDQLMLRRLKKEKLRLRDVMVSIEMQLTPKEPA